MSFTNTCIHLPHYLVYYVLKIRDADAFFLSHFLFSKFSEPHTNFVFPRMRSLGSCKAYFSYSVTESGYKTITCFSARNTQHGHCRKPQRAKFPSSIFAIFVTRSLRWVLMIFWVKSPCGLVGRIHSFGEACCLHLQGWSDHIILPTSPLRDLTWKNIIRISTVLKILNLTVFNMVIGTENILKTFSRNCC
jgi:hypothetical protein